MRDDDGYRSRDVTYAINETGRHGVHAAVWFVIIVVLVGSLLTWWMLATDRWVMQRQRENVQRSQQYVETQQEQLLLLVNEWHTSPDVSKPALEQRMRNHVTKLEESGAEVPDEAQEILNR